MGDNKDANLPSIPVKEGRVGNPTSPVKPFSVLKRVIYGILMIYGAWILANAVRFGTLGPLGEYEAETLKPIYDSAEWNVFMAGLSFLLLILGGFGGIRILLFPQGRIFQRLAPALVVLLVFLHVRIMFFERIEVSGDSMSPTLRPGQTFWVWKLKYNLHLPILRFPFGSPFPPYPHSDWDMESQTMPERGTIVAFHYPGNSSRYMLKRVIALPGEKFSFQNGKIFINDTELKEPYLAPGTVSRPLPDEYQSHVLYPPPSLKRLDPLVEYSALHGCGEAGIVPRGAVLVLGDNRRKSRDSRSMGYVPLFYLTGSVSVK